MPSLHWNCCCLRHSVMCPSYLKLVGRKHGNSAEKTPAKPRILPSDLADLTSWGVGVPLLSQPRECDCLLEAWQLWVSIDSSWLQSGTAINPCPILNKSNACFLVKLCDLFENEWKKWNTYYMQIPVQHGMCSLRLYEVLNAYWYKCSPPLFKR